MKRDENTRIAFFGSSLVSAYWNGAATYYRGIIKYLNKLGYHITFFEPDAYERQQHRDMEDPDWAEVVVYPNNEKIARQMVDRAKNYDVVVKASGVGVFDELLEKLVIEKRQPGQLVIFWDVDAPATLARIQNDKNDYFRSVLPEYDTVFTYGGGDPVVKKYKSFGAKDCIPIYNALDPDTHHPTVPDKKFEADLAFLGNRLPDRERRVEEFFLNAAAEASDKRFIIGGSGWADKVMPENVEYVGHVYTNDHNAFNCTPLAVLNISRDSMADNGFSPATRVFEAAGAGACLITDKWVGIDHFLEPGKEVLVAHDGAEVAKILKELTPEEAHKIGNAALRRVLSEHTYAHRAEQVNEVFSDMMAARKKAIA